MLGVGGVYTEAIKKSKAGAALPTVLLILVGLEYYCGERGIALYALGCTYASIFGVESPCVKVCKVVLNTGGSFCGVIVEVVNVYIPSSVYSAYCVGRR